MYGKYSLQYFIIFLKVIISLITHDMSVNFNLTKDHWHHVSTKKATDIIWTWATVLHLDGMILSLILSQKTFNYGKYYLIKLTCKRKH